jgi:hypothetical protein
VKWEMIRWILIGAPLRHGQFRATVSKADLPRLDVPSMRQLKRLYAAWELERPGPAVRATTSSSRR